MLGDDPPYLSVGTEVSAKYKGAFCEAKIKKVVRSVKCRVTFKQGLGTSTVTDDQIKGNLRVGALVEAKHSDKKDFVEATITKIQDCSQYTVVFDDGDITTLRRTALCLKSGRHFAESETLDQLPLTHPEHFGNPVIGGRRGRRSRQTQDDSSDDEDDQGNNDSGSGSSKEGNETEPEIGRVVCVEYHMQRKKDNWFPGLVAAPTAQDTVRIDVQDDYLVRSFKDGRYYTVPKTETFEFTKDLVNKVENSVLKTAVEKALLYLEKNELPTHWDRDSLFGINTASSGNSDTEGELNSDSSDDEPREEKDHFVAQLYKFMDDRGTPINNCPMIGNDDIDLYRLFRIVYKLGGYNRVTNQNLWKHVSRRLGFMTQPTPSTHNLVKQAYKKFLHSFEDFYRKLGCTMVNHPRTSVRKQKPGRSLIRDKDRNTPVPQQSSNSTHLKLDKDEEDEKPLVKEEQPEPKKETKVEPKKIVVPKEEELLAKLTSNKKTKEEPPEVSASDNESDVNVEGGGESSSSERSQKLNGLKKVIKKKQQPPPVAEKPKKSEPPKKIVEAKAKTKDEESTKTRSRSKEDIVKGKEEISTSQLPEPKVQVPPKETKDSETKKALTPKPTKKVNSQQQLQQQQQQQQQEEEMKKRGRKRKETKEEKGKSTDEQSSENSTPSYKGPVEVGDRVKVYYGKTHITPKMTYEAKVIRIKVDKESEPLYLVHYLGWNVRYDEWIKSRRIAHNYTQAQDRVKRSKAVPRPQTPSVNSTSTSSKLARTPAGAQSRRRAQSVAPSSGSQTFLSNKDLAKEVRESSRDTTSATRSTTSSPLTNYSSRTKSPASSLSNRSCRTTRQVDSSLIELGRRTRRTSSQVDNVGVSESDPDLDSCDAGGNNSDDTTEPETPSSRSRLPRNRREARRRAESRMKIEETSDGEVEKEPDEPRQRGRKLRKLKDSGKPEVAKSEADSGEEQPKAGRDYDLNQIRSELKGFDKAIKIEKEEETQSKEEPEVVEKKEEVAITTTPVKREIKAEVTSDSTEDIYEFKEPEPFEFEVRNKRDSSSSDKDKPKKRVFEQEEKSPKKKQKTHEEDFPTLEDLMKIVAEPEEKKEKKEEVVTSPKKKQTQASQQQQGAKATPEKNEIKEDGNQVEVKKKVRKLSGKKVPETNSDDTDERDKEVAKYFAKEVPEKKEKKEVVEEEVKKEVKKKQQPIKSYQKQQQLPVEVQKKTPFDDMLEQFKPVIAEASVPNELQTKEPPLVVKTHPPKIQPHPTTTISPETKIPLIETKPQPSQPQQPAPMPMPAIVSISDKLVGKLPETKPTPVDSPPATNTGTTAHTLPVLAPISARLPAALSIEEKLSAAAVFRSKIQKDAANGKKDGDVTDASSDVKKPVSKEVLTKKQPETYSKKNIVNKEDTKILTLKSETKKPASSSMMMMMQDKEVRKDPLLAVMKQKEEQQQNKKQQEPPRISDDIVYGMISESRNCYGNKESLISKVIKSTIDRDSFDSADSSDSEKKLTICDIIEDTVQESNKKIPLQQQQSESEDRDNMNSLLCEEEIPGSPTPEITNSNQQKTESSAPQSSAIITSTSMPLPVPVPVVQSMRQQQLQQPQQFHHHHHQVIVHHHHHHVLQQQQQQLPHHQVNLPPNQQQQQQEAAPVMDNTPPTTPDSTISNMSGSSRDARTAGSSPSSEDNQKPSSAEMEDCETNKSAVDTPQDAAIPKPPAKRAVEDSVASPKKRKKRKDSEANSTSGKKSPRQSRAGSAKTSQVGIGSDSDDTSESSSLLCVANAMNSGTGGTTIIHVNSHTVEFDGYSSRSPRLSKYNFCSELDPDLDGNQRISILQQRLTDLRKAYNSVKSELAAVERRRKKLKRREREAMKAAKAEMQQACS